jgi:hypothetical protein
MKQITINDRAIAKAIDHVAGPDARLQIVSMYELLNEAETLGYKEGFGVGHSVGRAQEDDANEEGYRDGFSNGYDMARAVMDGVATQPDVHVLPAYEGDSGDEELDKDAQATLDAWKRYAQG